MQKKTTTKAKTTNGNGFSAVATATTLATTTPSRDQIARRAYELYVARGRAGGHELEDWIQAERELAGKTHSHN
jgi:hypothetical protein